MRFLQFLRYQTFLIGLAATVYFVTILVIYLDVSARLSFKTSLYAGGLVLFVVILFTLLQFISVERSLKQFEKGNEMPFSYEAEYYQELIRKNERKMIKTVNELRKQQYDTRDFMISWFHEIKTPISVLQLKQQTERGAKNIADEIDKINYYVEQALYYAKLESFTDDYDIRYISLDQLVRERVKYHSRMFISKRISISLEVEKIQVLSDKIWLRFILDQFLTNSLKYTNEGGAITISTATQQNEQQLIIKDNGVGIPEDELERIFLRGFTGSNGRLYAKSTGMGLYLAKKMAEKLDHKISCQSELGIYTEMTIHFPLNDTKYTELVRH
jgi:signal transduction histidine kinase